MVGIEGDLTWGVRTLQEWTFLQEDIDAQVLAGAISVRPETMRVPFKIFQFRVAEVRLNNFKPRFPQLSN